MKTTAVPTLGNQIRNLLEILKVAGEHWCQKQSSHNCLGKLLFGDKWQFPGFESNLMVPFRSHDTRCWTRSCFFRPVRNRITARRANAFQESLKRNSVAWLDSGDADFRGSHCAPSGYVFLHLALLGITVRKCDGRLERHPKPGGSYARPMRSSAERYNSELFALHLHLRRNWRKCKRDAG